MAVLGFTTNVVSHNSGLPFTICALDVLLPLSLFSILVPDLGFGAIDYEN